MRLNSRHLIVAGVCTILLVLVQLVYVIHASAAFNCKIWPFKSSSFTKDN